MNSCVLLMGNRVSRSSREDHSSRDRGLPDALARTQAGAAPAGSRVPASVSRSLQCREQCLPRGSEGL